jgi:hypothetical protein
LSPTRSAAYRVRGAARPRLRDPAVLEHDDPVGEGHRLDGIVRDQEPRTVETRERSPEQGAQLGTGRDVDGRERLVEDQDARIAREGARQRDALARAARQRRGPRPRVHRRGHAGQDLTSVCARGARPRAARAPRERHVLQRAEVREQDSVLERDADRPALWRQAVDPFTVERHPAPRLGHEPGDGFDDRGLPRAVRAEDRDGLVRRGLERRLDRPLAARDREVDQQGHWAPRHLRPVSRPPRVTSTASETTTRINDNRIAPPWSTWRAS